MLARPFLLHSRNIRPVHRVADIFPVVLEPLSMALKPYSNVSLSLKAFISIAIVMKMFSFCDNLSPICILHYQWFCLHWMNVSFFSRLQAPVWLAGVELSHIDSQSLVFWWRVWQNPAVCSDLWLAGEGTQLFTLNDDICGEWCAMGHSTEAKLYQGMLLTLASHSHSMLG